MKKSIIYLAILSFVVISCKKEAETNTETTTVEVTEEAPSLVGVWELTSFINYDGEGVADTIPASASNKQIKMYTEHKIMWSRFNAADSVDWFGYGDYKVVDDQLIETLEYGSKSMNAAIQDAATFTFDLVIDENSFSQLSMDEDGHVIFAENYHRIED